MIIDIFSKWVELIPLKKATATQLEFGFRVLTLILSHFGALRRLFCDNGTPNGVKLEYTAPYSPQKNLTERASRTIKTRIP